MEVQIRSNQGRKKPYKAWDKRVFDRWIEHGYRELSVLTKKDSRDNDSDRPLALATSKYQEVLQYLRPNFSNYKPAEQCDVDETSHLPHDPLLYPDNIGPSHTISPFYRNEPILAWKLLRHIRPAVLLLHGENSPVAPPQVRAEMLNRTGVGIGGNGGVENSRVCQEVLKGSHQLPLERVGDTASVLGPWIGQSAQSWKEDEDRLAERWTRESINDRLIGMAGWVPVLQEIYASKAQKCDSRL